ncbi:MAG: hypothetical protein RMJ17_02940 [Candidatus Aenigmarchaeota archaeon]|nr:hypothetical protein [Candidatus Aenigmarchaeota archaeon]MDW8149523.1 hypothetical protein [Candidatus Aenigmarchaeota archaeon]
MEIVNSIDLFDTLITRDLYSPKDLFYFVGKKNLKEIDPILFQKIRIKAEETARKKAIKNGKEEVSIEEIYEELRKNLNLDFDKIDKIMKAEIEMEKEACVPVADNLKFLSDKTIIVSDFYLSKDIISEILKKCGIFKYKELFVSSEFGVTKISGKLFGYIMSKYCIGKHIGDNKVSDVKIPKKFNIPAEHYRNSLPSRYEKAIYYCNQIPYDFRSTLAGAMKATRLSLAYDDLHFQTIHNVSANVVGPFLFSYVYWVLYKANEVGLEKLFFLSRDGQILSEIAHKISNSFNEFKNIKMKYLYVSRKTLYLPTIVNDKDITLIPKVLKIDNFEKEFNISSNQDILKTAKEKREKLIGYLLQEGFDKDSKIGVVDVGWRGRLQFCISKVLDLAGFYNGITGFYVGLINPVPVFGKDKRYTFFSTKNNYHILSAPIIETFCGATHGLTIDYGILNDKFYPILKEKENLEMINWGLKVQQESVKLFCDLFLNNIQKYEIILNLEDLQKISRIVLNLFINNPTKIEAKTYGSISHYPDVNEKEKFSLADKVGYIDTIRLLLELKKFKFLTPRKKNLWREGTIVLSIPKPFYKIFLTALWARKKVEEKLLT